jgi:hypothetical protein
VFGGVSISWSNVISDFWRFNSSDYSWTWLSGPAPTSPNANNPTPAQQAYGTLNPLSPGPGSRGYGRSLWIISSNLVILQGGFNNNGEQLDGIWAYYTDHNLWSWVGGSLGLSISMPQFTKGQETFSVLPYIFYGFTGCRNGQLDCFLFGNQSSFWRVRLNTVNCPTGYRFELNKSLCYPCEAGKFSFASGNSSTCFECPAGKFNILTGSSSEAACIGCPPGKFNFQPGKTECTNCPLGSYSVGQKSFCDLCGTGSSTSGNGSTSISDCYCPQLFYGRAFNGDPCRPCTISDGVTCMVNSSLPFVSRGFARSTTDPSMVVVCQPIQACSETGFSNVTICSLGYSGSSCESCMAGFYRLGLSCKECPSTVWTTMGWMLLLLALVFLLRKVSRNDSLQRVEFRTTVLGIQTLALLPALSSSWPPTLSFVLNGISLSNLNIDFFAPGKFQLSQIKVSHIIAHRMLSQKNRFLHQVFAQDDKSFRIVCCVSSLFFRNEEIHFSILPTSNISRFSVTVFLADLFILHLADCWCSFSFCLCSIRKWI